LPFLISVDQAFSLRVIVPASTTSTIPLCSRSLISLPRASRCPWQSWSRWRD